MNWRDRVKKFNQEKVPEIVDRWIEFKKLRSKNDENDISFFSPLDREAALESMLHRYENLLIEVREMVEESRNLEEFGVLFNMLLRKCGYEEE